MQASHESIAVFPSVTLGILAGGQAIRLGGIEKAWLQSDGIPHVLRLRDVFATQVKAIAVSANRNLSRYTQHGLQTVPDQIADVGPLAGVDALLAMCQTQWLLTLPVDLVAVPADLLERLAANRQANGQGTFAQDDDGPQPLIALWPVAKARGAIARALDCNAHAVHKLQGRLEMSATRFEGFRFGNLNTAEDLDAAGVTLGNPEKPARSDEK